MVAICRPLIGTSDQLTGKDLYRATTGFLRPHRKDDPFHHLMQQTRGIEDMYYKPDPNETIVLPSASPDPLFNNDVITVLKCKTCGLK